MLIISVILYWRAWYLMKTREGKNIILAASVSYPQTDLYIPFSITITPEGKMSISKNEDMEELPPMLGDSLN